MIDKFKVDESNIEELLTKIGKLDIEGYTGYMEVEQLISPIVGHINKVLSKVKSNKTTHPLYLKWRETIIAVVQRSTDDKVDIDILRKLFYGLTIISLQYANNSQTGRIAMKIVFDELDIEVNRLRKGELPKAVILVNMVVTEVGLLPIPSQKRLYRLLTTFIRLNPKTYGTPWLEDHLFIAKRLGLT